MPQNMREEIRELIRLDERTPIIKQEIIAGLIFIGWVAGTPPGEWQTESAIDTYEKILGELLYPLRNSMCKDCQHLVKCIGQEVRTAEVQECRDYRRIGEGNRL